MVDSDTDPDFDEVTDETPLRQRKVSTKRIAMASTLDIIMDGWRCISYSSKRDQIQRMHVCLFWSHILLRQHESHRTTQWAVQVGFLDQNVTSDLSLKRLYKLEILESILRALERGCLSDEQTMNLFLLSNQFNMQVDCTEEAVYWLEQTGEPDIISEVQKLGSPQRRFHTLSYIFIEYAYCVQALACKREEMLIEHIINPSQLAIQRSEMMKNKGNDYFQKKRFDSAVKWYTKAIKFHPENHFLYGNRALCYIRCEKYQKAICDGKRAAVIKPDWAKGHYRFCEGLFALGERKKALQANERAIGMCGCDPEGIKDLQQQNARFRAEMGHLGGPFASVEVKSKKTKPDSSNGPRMDLESLSSKNPPGSDQPGNDPLVKQKSEHRIGSGELPGKMAGAIPVEGSSTKPKELNTKMAEGNACKTEHCAPEKWKIKISPPVPQEKAVGTVSSKTSMDLKHQLKLLVQDAHTALADQRCRNAEQAFSQILKILDSGIPKDLGISELDTAVLIYGHASALLEIGLPEELAEAEKQFGKIQAMSVRKFQCLVYFGMGRVFLKKNRFLNALNQFNDALLMVKRQIIPGKLTWPTTQVTIDETQTEHFKALLQEYMNICKFPPKPDAVCRHQMCQGHSKMEIYFTDPDFKGFIRMICCQSCNVEFHISCWKKMKATLFSDKNEKDFLQETCFTPDCGAKIYQIIIFGSTGLTKCQFESSIPKNKVPVKSRVKQKCTSLKKLKSKEDRKIRRKQRRQVTSLTMQENTEHLTLEKSQVNDTEHQKKASSQSWLCFGDRVLHQISENKELFKEGIQDISALMKSLRPWMDLDAEKRDDAPCLTEPKALEDVANLVLEKNNRVWARVLIESLSNSPAVSPKLRDWAHRLDNIGLKAAETFIEHYAKHLEELDLAPLQEVLIEKFGTMPDFFRSAGLPVIEYLKQAPPREMRLFIWALEEKRGQFESCHHALDEYFEVMDGLCLVIKKTENENLINSPIKIRNRIRKKKPKDPKAVIVLGMRGGTSREEDNVDEDFFSEEDSFLLLDDNASFIVPDHLRHQIAEFEGQYVPSNHYRRVLDNNPDPTKESLYDYFYQILEKHGPMEANNQLLVGELENFPVEAQLKIQEAGSLEAFLKESLRFVVVGNRIGLMKHAASLQEVTGATRPEQLDLNVNPSLEDKNAMGPFLNPSAEEFHPSHNLFQLEDESNVFSNEASVPCDDVLLKPLQSGSQLQPFLTPFPLPETTSMDFPGFPQFSILNPLCSALHANNSGAVGIGAFGTVGMKKDVFSSNPYLENLGAIDPVAEMDFVDSNNEFPPRFVRQHKSSTKTVSLQAFCETKDDVAVNTEPYELFETNKGDMLKKEKDNTKFEKQIIQIVKDFEEENQKRRADISVLNGELQEINQNISVANKELELFQQKLEEEVKKDQEEKKENQEILKALKTKIKELSECNDILSKNIRERRKAYESEFHHSLEMSNQLAAKKASLEEEIKRCVALCAAAARRSQAAEMSILENRHTSRLRELYSGMSEREAILMKIKESVASFPSSGLQPAVEEWQAGVQDAQVKMAAFENQYKEQMELLKKGTRLCDLPPVPVPSASPTPVLSVLCPPSDSHQLLPRNHSNIGPQITQLPVRQKLLQGTGQRTPPVPSPTRMDAFLGKAGPQPNLAMQGPSAPVAHAYTSDATRKKSPTMAGLVGPQGHRAVTSPLAHIFEVIIDRLSNMFPHYKRETLCKFIQEVRSANGKTLTNLSYDEVINRVAQLILDHQENTREQMSANHRTDHNWFGAMAAVSQSPSPRSDSPASGRSSSTPPPSQAWKNVGAQNRFKAKALNVEDPCIICHEEMSKVDLCVLECRHSFHRECIKSWLKEQNTCPTCREHTLLPEDFPLLPGRTRRGNTPTTPSF